MVNILSFVDNSIGTSVGVIAGPLGNTVDALEAGFNFAYQFEYFVRIDVYVMYVENK